VASVGQEQSDRNGATRRRRKRALLATLAIGGISLLLFSVRSPRSVTCPPPPIATPVAPHAPSAAERARSEGHRRYAELAKRAALRDYDQALSLDPSVVDRQMVDNLVAAFDRQATRELAADIIARHQLHDAAAALRVIAQRGPSHGSRWGAVGALDRLDGVPDSLLVAAFIADLRDPSCAPRRHAATALGKLGSRQALAAVRVARDRELRQARLHPGVCLGDYNLASAKHRAHGGT
jgi:hypothetical protein